MMSSEATALPTATQFLIWVNPGLILFIFLLFISQFNYKLKNRRCCTLDSNPGPQDGKCRRIHRAMASQLLIIVDCPALRFAICEHLQDKGFVNIDFSKRILFSFSFCVFRIEFSIKSCNWLTRKMG